MLTPLHITTWVLDYRYAILFPLIVIEGPITMIIAGYLSSLGFLSLVVTYIIAVVGDLAGDSAYYAIGRWGSMGFIDRYGKYIGLSRAGVAKLEQRFERQGGKILLAGKATHVIGGAFLVAAGLVKMPYGQFLWFNFLATLVKALGLILIGYYFGAAIDLINHGLSVAGLAMIAIGLVTVGWLLARQRTSKRTQ